VKTNFLTHLQTKYYTDRELTPRFNSETQNMNLIHSATNPHVYPLYMPLVSQP